MNGAHLRAVLGDHPHVKPLKDGQLRSSIVDLDFIDYSPTNKAFKPITEIQQLVAPSGATGDKDVITYCRMSHRATVLYFVLTQLLGRRKVKVYDGSWTEWGNLVGVPVER